MRLYISCRIILVIILLTNIRAFASDSLQNNSLHPFLLVTAKQITEVKQSIQNHSWKEKSWQSLKRISDQYLKEKIEIPNRGGTWEQLYYSPLTNRNLIRGKQIGDWMWEHIDTATNQIFRGDTTKIETDYDGVIISFIHDKWAIGALQLGLSFQITADVKYAQKAKEILLAYATVYPNLSEKNQKSDAIDVITGRGKVHAQSLNEAIWLIDIMQASDLIWKFLKNDERAIIITNIIRPAIKLIDDNHAEQAANIQCWKNAAMGMAGFLLKDDRLIHKAIDDEKTGFFAQLKDGVTSDGFWLDISPSYHFYALQALVLLANAAGNYGLSIEAPVIQKMFTAPVHLATSYLTLPVMNDSKPINLAGSQAWLYEWAYNKYKDSASAVVLGISERELFQNPGPHFTGWSLLFGAEILPKLPTLNTVNINWADAGIGKLVSASQPYRETTLYTKFSNTYYRFHKHPDDLSFGIYRGIEPISTWPSYYNPSAINDNWYKTTLASNSFVVDEKQQQIQLSDNRDFGIDKNISYIINRSTNAYPLVHFVRTTAMINSNLILIVDQFRSWDSSRTFDITFHPEGTWLSAPFLKKWTPPNKPGYNTLKNTSVVNCLESFVTARSLSGSKIVISALQDSLMDVIIGNAKPFENVAKPIVIYRRTTNHAVMAWCISLDGQKVDLKLSNLNESTGQPIPQWDALRVQLRDEAKNHWSFIINPNKMDIQNNLKASDKRFLTEITSDHH